MPVLFIFSRVIFFMCQIIFPTFFVKDASIKYVMISYGDGVILARSLQGILCLFDKVLQ